MGYILKGIGDRVTGKNEIVPTFDAKIFNFYAQISPGVIGSENNKFPISVIDRGVTIGPGMAYAFGYFGLSDAVVQFNYTIPLSQTQYSKVYAEFDLSARPQEFAVKKTPQSDTSIIDLTQDNLSQITTGKYQVPLYLVTIQTNGTITFTDIRPMLNRVAYATHSNNSDNATNSKNLVAGGTIASDVVATTQAQSDNTRKVATTAYVRQAINDVKNIIRGDISIPVSYTGISANWVKRQVNFVIGKLYFDDSNANRYTTTYMKIGQIPEGFRPKNNIDFPIAYSDWTMSGNWISHWCTIQTDGGIYVQAKQLNGGGGSAIRAYGYKFDFCYEIT